MTDEILVAERLQDVHRLLARHGEDVLATLGGEAFDEEGGGRSAGRVGHHGRVYSPRRGRPAAVGYGCRGPPRGGVDQEATDGPPSSSSRPRSRAVWAPYSAG